MIRLSTGAAQSILDMGMYQTFYGNNFRIYLYSGDQPKTADDAPTGTLLVSAMIRVNNVMGPAADRAYSIPGAWQQVPIVQDEAGWWRLRHVSSDSNTTSTTDFRMDGTVSELDGPGDVQVADTTTTTGVTYYFPEVVLRYGDVFVNGGGSGALT